MIAYIIEKKTKHKNEESIFPIILFLKEKKEGWNFL